MKKRLLYFLILFIFFLIFALESEAISIDVSGSWGLTISANDLISGPCSGLQSDYESSTNAVTIDVSYASYNRTWRVSVRKIDQSWPNDFILFTRRTSYSYGVTGGTNYQEITNSNRTFISSNRDRINVSGLAVQFQLSGVSINIPPGTYITTIYYTIVEYY